MGPWVSLLSLLVEHWLSLVSLLLGSSGPGVLPMSILMGPWVSLLVGLCGFVSSPHPSFCPTSPAEATGFGVPPRPSW